MRGLVLGRWSLFIDVHAPDNEAHAKSVTGAQIGRYGVSRRPAPVSAHDGEKSPSSWETLELVLAAIVELDAVLTF